MKKQVQHLRSVFPPLLHCLPKIRGHTKFSRSTHTVHRWYLFQYYKCWIEFGFDALIRAKRWEELAALFHKYAHFDSIISQLQRSPEKSTLSGGNTSCTLKSRLLFSSNSKNDAKIIRRKFPSVNSLVKKSSGTYSYPLGDEICWSIW